MLAFDKMTYDDICWKKLFLLLFFLFLFGYLFLSIMRK